MNQESCEIHIINSIQNPNVPDTTHTTGLVLEVSVAITIRSEVNNKPILLYEVLIDTGCIRIACQIKFVNPGDNSMKLLRLQM
jgi:hypothetical protein